MSQKARAWFSGWFVTRKGGPGSGNYGHKGRPGMRGGSIPGGGHGALGLSTGATKEEIEEAQWELEAQRSKEAYEAAKRKEAEKKPGTPSETHKGFREDETEQLTGTIKPARRAPNYRGNDLNGAVRAAARMSLGHNMPFYVYRAFGKGYGLTYKKSGLSALESFLEVMGRKVTKLVRDWSSK